MSLRHPSIDRMHAGKFAAFADSMLLGALVVLGSLPVVTALPAIVAGVHLMREREAGDATVSFRTYFAAWREVIRTGPAWVLLSAGVALLAYAELFALAAGLPGNARIGLIAALVAVAAVLLRAAGSWAPGRGVVECLTDGVRTRRATTWWGRSCWPGPSS